MKKSLDISARIPREAYLGDPFRVVKNVLLGAYLCTDFGGEPAAGRITELELYLGDRDKACHAFRFGRTPRTAPMFGPGGHAYIFLVYGMHDQFCAVIGGEGEANAVLIRALEPVEGIGIMRFRRGTDKPDNLTTGPGKLCRALGITARHNGADLLNGHIWISPGRRVNPSDIVARPRVGIGYAEEYAAKPWRFYIKGSRFISKN